MTDWEFRTGLADPFRELRRFQDEVHRLFSGFEDQRGREFPPMNLWASTDGVVVTAEVPGVPTDKLTITVHKNTLTVSGDRPVEALTADAAVLRRERPVGPFSRTVVLPFLVDAEKVEARSESGVLVIHLPRPEADRPRRIALN